MNKRILASLAATFLLRCGLAIAQSPFDDLQAAYDQYSHAKFKPAAATFDKFFKSGLATANDYYFAAICQAQAGKKVKALDYADKAAYGIETYAMMLADEQFKPVHAEIRARYQALEKFYELFNLGTRNSGNAGMYARKLDSTYWALPVRRLNIMDYPALARELKNQLTDTLRALQLIQDAMTAANVQSLEFFRGAAAAKSFERMARWLPPSLEPKLTNLLEQYGYHTELGMMLGPGRPVHLKSLFEALCTLPEESAKLLTEPDLQAYYAGAEGQALLRYWLSTKVVPAILESDVVFPYTMKEYSESQRQVYEYMRATNFAAAIPRRFDIYRHDDAGQGQQYVVPRFQESESPASKDWNVAVKLTPKGLVLTEEKSDKLVLLKTIGTSQFAGSTGDYHRQPLANMEFIRRVKDGKFPYYTVALIQAKHLRPLTTARILARLKTNIESDDETFFFAFETNIRWMADALPHVMAAVPASDRAEAIEVIRWFHATHPQLVHDAVALMTGPDQYTDASPDAKRQFRRTAGQLNELLPDIFTENYKDATNIDLYGAADNEFAALLKQRGQRIAEAWEAFTKVNPYALPEFIASRKTIVKEVTSDSDDFFMEDAKPVFYDPSDYRVFKDGKVYHAGYGEVSAAGYEKFVKDPLSAKATAMEEVAAEEEMVAVAVEAAPETDVMMDEPVSAHTGQPLVKGSSFDGTAYLFTPSHHTNSPELLRLKATDDDVSRLKKLSGALGLNPNEYVRTQNGFNIYYDRFYAFNAFGKIAVFCHDNDVIFSGYLDQPDVLTKRTHIFHGTVAGTCSDRHASYTEKVSCLNRLQVAPLGERLAVMGSISVSGEPYCSSGQYCRTVVKVVDKDLKVVKERMIPALDEPPAKFNSNTDIKLVVQDDRIFAFVVPDCCGPAPMHLMVLDKDLNVIAPLQELTALSGQIAMANPSLAVTTRGNELVVAYAVNHNNDILVELRKVNREGKLSAPAYLQKLDGVILSNELSATKATLEYHYVEKEGDLYFFKKLDIPWSAIDNLK